jgi:ankyrin repeat protein
MAIKAKNRAMVEYLISRGARAGVSKDNLLIYAFQKSPVGVEAMLKGGINPNFKDKNGNTPLIIAAASGDFESIQYLLAYRAEINAVNNLGMTPLLYAIKAKRLDIIPYLLDRGAEVNTANNLGETPLYWAAYLGLDKITQDLLQLGADYNKKTNKNITALQIAITNGHKTTQKVIADFIAFKNIPRDKNGNPIVKTNEATTGATSSKKTKTTAKSASKATNNAASKAAANNIAATTGSPDVQNMAANGIIPVYQGAQPADATPPAPANTSTNDNWMKPKTEKPSTQKTQINKLKTSNNR